MKDFQVVGVIENQTNVEKETLLEGKVGTMASE